MIKASVFADLQTGRKMSCPWNPSLFAHSGSAQLYEYCMFKMFVLKMEQKKKEKKKKKIQQLCQGCDLVTLQLHKLFDGTFVFDFTPEAAFPASAVGDGKYSLYVGASWQMRTS